MRPNFSEFTYGYAATRALESMAASSFGGISAPPLLPSLKAEKDLGYDVQVLTVRLAIFVQFKLGEHVSRGHPDSPTWVHLNAPHYRMTVDTGDHQFVALADLEKRGHFAGRPLLVAYLAPAFHRREKFWLHYSSGTILENSYGSAPSDFPSGGAVHHCVTIPALSAQWILSEPQEVTNWVGIENLGARVRDITEGSDTQFSLVSLEQQMRAACVTSGLVPPRLLNRLEQDDRGVLDQIHVWSQLLGVVPLIWAVNPPEPVQAAQLARSMNDS